VAARMGGIDGRSTDAGLRVHSEGNRKALVVRWRVLILSLLAHTKLKTVRRRTPFADLSLQRRGLLRVQATEDSYKQTSPVQR
jgi:hypothetical protein